MSSVAPDLWKYLIVPCSHAAGGWPLAQIALNSASSMLAMGAPPYLSSSLGMPVAGLGAVPFLRDRIATRISPLVRGASRPSAATGCCWPCTWARYSETLAVTPCLHPSSNWGFAAPNSAWLPRARVWLACAPNTPAGVECRCPVAGSTMAAGASACAVCLYNKDRGKALGLAPRRSPQSS